MDHQINHKEIEMNTRFRTQLILFTVFWIGSMNISFSQVEGNAEGKSPIHLLGQSIEGKILLRWGPSDYELWQKMNAEGIILQRAVVPADEEGFDNYKFDPSFTKLIKPLAKEDPKWESNLDQDDYVTAAWIALYEEQPLISGDLAAMINGQDNINKKAFFVGMLAADHSHLAAQSMGLGFEDSDVTPGVKYFYKVSLASDSTVVDQELIRHQSSISIEVATAPITESQEKAILLKWSRDYDGGNFTSYIIERSENKEGPFVSLTNTPYLRIKSNPNATSESFASFVDSVGVNNKPFYYRITGINPFGIKSTPSHVVMGMGVDLTPPIPPYGLLVEEQPDKTFKLTWKKDNRESDFLGYIVSKASDFEGPYNAIHDDELPFLSHSIIDNNVGVGIRNYYSVAALDTSGNVSTSLIKIGIIADDSPIQTPVGLTGSIDENGVVTINWEKSTDPRVIGYKVYSSNSPNHRFLMKPGERIEGTTYTEKVALRTLSERIIYKVAALNNGYAYSELSEGLELKRPDVVPPSFSVFTNREIKDDGVKLEWAISHTHDLVEQQLWRKTNGQEWELLKKFGTEIDSYEDDTLEPGVEYAYALKSKDDAGLESEFSPIMTASLSAYQELETVKNLKAVYNKDSKETVLTWEYPNSKSYDFLVYKSEDSANLRALKKVGGSESYNDRRVKKDKKYSYAIRVIAKDGRESSISESTLISID